jgi:hypothetical protein
MKKIVFVAVVALIGFGAYMAWAAPPAWLESWTGPVSPRDDAEQGSEAGEDAEWQVEIVDADGNPITPRGKGWWSGVLSSNASVKATFASGPRKSLKTNSAACGKSPQGQDPITSRR